MLRTIVVKMCDCAMDLVGSMRWAWADRAYWFFWKVRFYAMGYSDGDTVGTPCWYCLVGAENPNDPEDVSCQYCLSGEVNPEAERHWLNEDSDFCWYCQVGANHPADGVPMKGCVKDVLADSPESSSGQALGIAPERLDNGKCGCDRPRLNIRPCGHCACASECDECSANKLWRDEQESWCGCAQPGLNGVLNCGHCACGFGCFEVIRNGSDAPMQKVPCA